MTNKKVGIVGAGNMGLAIAYAMEKKINFKNIITDWWIK